jgi:hypothetical protein
VNASVNAKTNGRVRFSGPVTSVGGNNVQTSAAPCPRDKRRDEPPQLPGTSSTKKEPRHDRAEHHVRPATRHQPDPRATRRNSAQHFRKAPDVAPLPLTDQQRRAAALLALGRTDQHVRAELRLSRYALWRWRTKNPAFRAEIARRRQALWNNSADHLRALMPKALKVLSAHMKSNYDRTSYRAAIALLRLAGASKIAPPDDPTDEIEILRQDILRDRRRDNPADPDTTVSPDEFNERVSALLAECAPEHPSPEYEI